MSPLRIQCASLTYRPSADTQTTDHLPAAMRTTTKKTPKQKGRTWSWKRTNIGYKYKIALKRKKLNQFCVVDSRRFLKTKNNCQVLIHVTCFSVSFAIVVHKDISKQTLWAIKKIKVRCGTFGISESQITSAHSRSPDCLKQIYLKCSNSTKEKLFQQQ